MITGRPLQIFGRHKPRCAVVDVSHVNVIALPHLLKKANTIVKHDVFACWEVSVWGNATVSLLFFLLFSNIPVPLKIHKLWAVWAIRIIGLLQLIQLILVTGSGHRHAYVLVGVGNYCVLRCGKRIWRYKTCWMGRRHLWENSLNFSLVWVHKNCIPAHTYSCEYEGSAIYFQRFDNRINILKKKMKMQKIWTSIITTRVQYKLESSRNAQIHWYKLNKMHLHMRMGWTDKRSVACPALVIGWHPRLVGNLMGNHADMLKKSDLYFE